MKNGIPDERPITLRDEEKLVEGRGSWRLGWVVLAGGILALSVVLVLFLRGGLSTPGGDFRVGEEWRLVLAERGVWPERRLDGILGHVRPRPHKASVRPFEYRELDFRPKMAPRRSFVASVGRARVDGPHGMGGWTSFGFTDAVTLRSCWFEWECSDEGGVALSRPRLAEQKPAERARSGPELGAPARAGGPKNRVRVVRAEVQAGHGKKGREGAKSRTVWAVQVRAYRDPELAERYVLVLKEKGFRARIERHVDERGDVWYRVRIGRFEDVSAARAFARKVASAIGDEAIVVALDVF